MDPRKPMTGLGVLILAAVALGTAVLAGAGVWWWQHRANADLRDQLTASRQRVDDLTDQVARLQAAASRVATPKAPLDADAGETGNPVVDDPDTGLPPASEKQRQFAYVKDVNETAGTYEWVLDYAQMLTGEAAADAAAAAGDESPPPNDYYIVNSNPRLRTFPVKAGTKVVLLFNGFSEKRPVSLGEFYDIYINKTDYKYAAPYWVTIQGGKIIAAEEQYLP